MNKADYQTRSVRNLLAIADSSPLPTGCFEASGHGMEGTSDELETTDVVIYDDDTMVSPSTKDLINRSKEEVEGRRQKQPSNSFQEDSSQQQLEASEHSSVLSEDGPQHDDSLPPLEDPPGHERQDPDSAPDGTMTMLTVPSLNDPPEAPEANPPEETRPDPLEDSTDFTRQLERGSSSYSADFERRDDLRSEPSVGSLDFDSIFLQRSSTEMSHDKFTNSHQSVLSTLSHQINAFGHQEDPCCRGRRSWLIYLAIVVLLVVLLAAFMDSDESLDGPPRATSVAPSITMSPTMTMSPSSSPSTMDPLTFHGEVPNLRLLRSSTVPRRQTRAS